ncbi:tryptophan synthase subunit beta [Paracholeplasma manati]|uniref:Tryptophan synthase beta chain n=1 Tax=Paracholeplasma manati TaxID=591373 RepID=A0ABT2Y720_9MOLU|nr:tryptophan synthase subunit beta [Paracholeplasma manati]MCV2232527.1 tryptophan synthase subunit beta [Paracholeplasma manati]MDG0889020.1 tryptophan synthase subunit beta [Paracholeplasma manati]
MEFGSFGGQFVPGKILDAVKKVEQAYEEAMKDPSFLEEYRQYLKEYVGRPSLLYEAKRLTEHLGGARIFLKREDLNHTGAHKINNVLGQALLAKRMGIKKLIAETGAGQHGVATATVAALMGMACEIHMGAVDVEKQSLNVYRMKMLGAKVVVVEEGLKTLKEAVDSALITWANELDTTFYLIGSAVGPHPYPIMVREFQKVIGEEIKAQLQATEQRLPDYVLACVGGGSNAIGAFYDFIQNPSVKLIGVEAAGDGVDTKRHAATMTLGKTGIIHGMQTKVLLEDDGSISEVYSISAGLDYPGVGPEHSYLESIHRVQYVAATDQEAVDAFMLLTKTEGIIPAIESSHAVAYAIKLAPTLPKENILVINLSGRGDKDVKQIARFLGETLID